MYKMMEERKKEAFAEIDIFISRLVLPEATTRLMQQYCRLQYAAGALAMLDCVSGDAPKLGEAHDG